jgi:hypothetical protein
MPRGGDGDFCRASHGRTSAVSGRRPTDPAYGASIQDSCHKEVPDMQVQESQKVAKYLRVRVVDHTKEGRPAVNIKVPVGVVKWGMKMAQAFSPQMKDVDLDWNSIEAMVQEGETGKIVEVEDETEHKTVEVWLE